MTARLWRWVHGGDGDPSGDDNQISKGKNKGKDKNKGKGRELSEI